MTRRKFPHDKPTDAEFQKFWSVFEAKQQRKRQQLQQPPLDISARENTHDNRP